MSTISGNVNADRVILVHRDTHVPVYETAPDAAGDWSVVVPDGEPFMAIYIKTECPPEMHGPYWGDV